VDVIVDPTHVVLQEVPTETMNADYDGSIHLALSPITDENGLRISYHRQDIKCDIYGGPDVSSAATWAMVHKNSNGEVDLHLKCRLPGQYQAQVFLYGRPLLSNPLVFVVPQTDKSPKWDEEENELTSNPVAGRTSIFSIQGLKDRRGKPVESYPQPKLIMKFTGPSECVGTVITMRLGAWGVEFTPQVDGYYEAQLYFKQGNTEEPLLKDPLHSYIGTLGLHQQIAAGGKPMEITGDGVSLTLRPLCDHEGNLVEYNIDEIVVEYSGPESGTGLVEKLSDGRLRIFMQPQTPGNYSAQVFLNGRPVLARDVAMIVR